MRQWMNEKGKWNRSDFSDGDCMKRVPYMTKNRQCSWQIIKNYSAQRKQIAQGITTFRTPPLIIFMWRRSWISLVGRYHRTLTQHISLGHRWTSPLDTAIRQDETRWPGEQARVGEGQEAAWRARASCSSHRDNTVREDQPYHSSLSVPLTQHLDSGRQSGSAFRRQHQSP